MFIALRWRRERRMRDRLRQISLAHLNQVHPCEHDIQKRRTMTLLLGYYSPTIQNVRYLA